MWAQTHIQIQLQLQTQTQIQIQIQITHWLHTVDTAGGGWLTFAVGTVCHSLCDVAAQSYLCQYLYLYFVCIPFRFAFALVFVFSLVFVFAVGTVWCRGTLRSSRMSLAHNLLTINQTTKAPSSKCQIESWIEKIKDSWNLEFKVETSKQLRNEHPLAWTEKIKDSWNL